MPPRALEIVSPLARFVPPATVIDKPGYSAFFATALQSFLAKKNVNTLIISGSETDVCVLATVLDAFDRGFRVIVVGDELCSPSNQGHDALIMLYQTRFHRSDRAAHTRCGPRTLARRSVPPLPFVHCGSSGTFTKGKPYPLTKENHGHEQRDTQRRSAPAYQ